MFKGKSIKNVKTVTQGIRADVRPIVTAGVARAEALAAAWADGYWGAALSICCAAAFGFLLAVLFVLFECLIANKISTDI